MLEQIGGLDLPKQLIDKTDKFLSAIFGQSAKEIGELYADKIRYKRLKNQIEIFKKSIELLEQNGLSPKQLNLKTLVPLIENSSLEEDEILQTKWSILIANIASSPQSDLDPKLVKTLSQMTSLEARVLDSIYDIFINERKIIFDRAIEHKWNRYNTVDEISNERVKIRVDTINKKFEVGKEFIAISLENLITVGVIKYVEPEIEIVDDGSTGNISSKAKGDTDDLSFDLDLVANYYHSDDVYLTTYGKYFVQKCHL